MWDPYRYPMHTIDAYDDRRTRIRDPSTGSWSGPMGGRPIQVLERSREYVAVSTNTP
jgi:hypothetical protein